MINTRLKQQNNQLKLKKHVAAIHCSGHLSLVQRRICNALLYHAYHDLLNVDIHEIPISQLCKIIGYSGHNYDLIKNALKALVSTYVEWNLVDSNNIDEDWTASTILASVRLYGSICYYSYSPHMRQLLFSPQIYGTVNLIIQSKFKSSYGLALYENCLRYRNLPHTKWFTLDLFRKLMGVPENKYPIFRDLKRRVLDKSVNEINEYSDMRVQAEIDRAGRKVRAIRFQLQDKKKVKTTKSNIIEDVSLKGNNFIVNKMVEVFGFSYKQALGLVEKYGEDYIVNKISTIETSDSYNKGAISNLSAYLLSAIKNDYSSPKKSKNVSIEKNKKEFQNFKNKMKREDEEHKLRKKYNEYSILQLNLLIDNLPKPKKEGINLHFKDYLSSKGNLLWNMYKKYKFENMIIKTEYRKFIYEFYPSVIREEISFDQYLELIKSEL